ncbi:30S ribosomal subunit protein S3 [Alphaproteobacteria bacterium]
MGQKVNPIGMRLGINKLWGSVWYADRDYAERLHQDLAIRKFITVSLASAAVGKVVIQRLAKKTRIMIHSARPGVVVGRKGEEIAKIKIFAEKTTKTEVSVNVAEIKKSEIDAKLIAESIAQQVQNRVSYKKAMKKAIQAALKMGAQGIKVYVSGRLGGAEIARTEWYKEGQVPLQTFRADIDYATAKAYATYGVIGVKVWIFHSEKKGTPRS